MINFTTNNNKNKDYMANPFPVQIVLLSLIKLMV